MKSFPPISSKLPVIWHGGDYNPEQWPRAIWNEDDRLMSEAHWNSTTLGVFSWVTLESEEGAFNFEWLDDVMAIQSRAGRIVGLATPSAAAPAWLSRKYPETLRVGPDGVRRKHGNRVNYCLTSPTYREKTRQMAQRLAERYADHPALGYWHISNELGGECYCNLCQAAFRRWLGDRYGTLEALNRAYWTTFWSHTYTDWEQIEAPGLPYGETCITGLTVDWKRFTTHQIVDFYLNEANVVREFAPGVPVTTNLMGTYPGLDPWKIAPHVDFAAWDSYPFFGGKPTDPDSWIYTAFTHDLNRCLKSKPFILMECAPSASNWYSVMKLKRPNAHRLEGLQAVAHGADGVQYFQWRQGRGSAEQFHGAALAHNNRSDARVFREIADLGKTLAELNDVVGTHSKSDVAILYDWEVSWMIEAVAAPRTDGKDYTKTVLSHYKPLWERSVHVDVISSECDLAPYKLVVAPMLFMLKPGVAEHLADFVRTGGTLVTTYWSGVVDESGLAFLGGYPSPLKEALGIWSEEIDALYDGECNEVIDLDGKRFEATQLCELVHLDTAEALMVYGKDFYAGRPAVTVNRYGSGKAYFIASRNETAFHRAFFDDLISGLCLTSALSEELPAGVAARRRTGEAEYLFILNCTADAKIVDLPEGWRDAFNLATKQGEIALEPFGSAVLIGDPIGPSSEQALTARAGS